MIYYSKVCMVFYSLKLYLPGYFIYLCNAQNSFQNLRNLVKLWSDMKRDESHFKIVSRQEIVERRRLVVNENVS